MVLPAAVFLILLTHFQMGHVDLVRGKREARFGEAEAGQERMPPRGTQLQGSR